MSSLNRRQFLRSAGGVTFLALTPVARGFFAAPEKTAASPLLFTALPYIQPGANSKLAEGRESMILAWQTQARPAQFEVTFGEAAPLNRPATIARTERAAGGEDGLNGRFNYAATLDALKLGRKYFYRVRCNGATISEGFFTTRQPRGAKIRFVAFGDNSFGDISDRAIAFQAHRANPDFVMNTGDNVYDGGRDNEYARYFFPVYNANVAAPRIGAPLLASVPFYSVMANHDVSSRNAENHPAANFDQSPDSLAYYTALHLPLNGPPPAQPTTIFGAKEHIDRFKACAGARFPTMANYSFDVGDAHFLCLDSNIYIDPTNAALQNWIAADLKATDARWKFVVFHHPAFNVGDTHYTEQHMRVLSPIFEAHGVDIALHGHEHTYQRTRPFRFAPADIKNASNINSGERLVPGRFSIDREFDGKTRTRPQGILYLTTGAGGKSLYDPAQNDNPAQWLHQRDNNADYVVRFVSDRHSLSVFEIDGGTLTMSQVDESGQTIDSIRITKA